MMIHHTFHRFDVLGQGQWNDGQSISAIGISRQMIELRMSDAEDAVVQVAEEIVNFGDV